MLCPACLDEGRALVGGERRVFEGVARHDYSLYHSADGLGWSFSDASEWLEGLEGKRVRITAEVLDEPSAGKERG